MEFDLSLITNSLPLLLQGALVTLEITAMAVGLGLVFGLLAALAQLSSSTKRPRPSGWEAGQPFDTSILKEYQQGIDTKA